MACGRGQDEAVLSWVVSRLAWRESLFAPSLRPAAADVSTRGGKALAWEAGGCSVESAGLFSGIEWRSGSAESARDPPLRLAMSSGGSGSRAPVLSGGVSS